MLTVQTLLTLTWSDKLPRTKDPPQKPSRQSALPPAAYLHKLLPLPTGWRQLWLKPSGGRDGPAASPGPSQWALQHLGQCAAAKCNGLTPVHHRRPLGATWNWLCHFPNTFTSHSPLAAAVQSWECFLLLRPSQERKPACLAAQKVSFKEENASLSQKVALSLRQVFLNSGAAQTSKNSVLLLG